MQTILPNYFYTSHLYAGHPLLLQKIVSFTKIFTDNDESVTVTITEGISGFYSLIVQSKSIIDRKVIMKFEEQIHNNNQLKTEFSHATMDVKRVGSHFPPTFVLSAYFAHDYGYLNYLLDGGISFDFKLRKILKEINGGVYFYKFYKTKFVFILESNTPFLEEDIERAVVHLSVNPHLKLLSLYSNFRFNSNPKPA